MLATGTVGQLHTDTVALPEISVYTVAMETANRI
jgi:hypothetical protein